MFPPRKVFQFYVSKVTRFGIYSGFGQLVFKGLNVLCTRNPVLHLREHPDDAITVERGLVIILERSSKAQVSKLQSVTTSGSPKIDIIEDYDCMHLNVQYTMI